MNFYIGFMSGALFVSIIVMRFETSKDKNYEQQINQYKDSLKVANQRIDSANKIFNSKTIIYW